MGFVPEETKFYDNTVLIMPSLSCLPFREVPSLPSEPLPTRSAEGTAVGVPLWPQCGSWPASQRSGFSWSLFLVLFKEESTDCYVEIEYTYPCSILIVRAHKCSVNYIVIVIFIKSSIVPNANLAKG